MKKLFLLSVSVLAAVFMITFSASAGVIDTNYDETPDPNEVYIDGSIAYAGSGCPADTVAGFIADDAKAFTLAFDSYFAEAGPGVSRRYNRANCTLQIPIHIPNGWTFTVYRVDYRGYAYLDEGTTGTQGASYYFAGKPETAYYDSVMEGPMNDDYELSHYIGDSQQVFSPCGEQRNIVINSDVQVVATGDLWAYLTVDTIDAEVVHEYKVLWERCN